MEAGVSLLLSQEHATCPYHETDQFILQLHPVTKDPF